MDEIQSLANSLRAVAHNSAENNGISRTRIEKLATIALIHEQISKHASAKSTAAMVAGLAIPGAITGAYGYSKGKQKGKNLGRGEMYQSAAPHVKRERSRARASEAMAALARKYYERMLREKSASKGKALLAGVGLSVPAYIGGKYYGKSKGREAGHKEVARSAVSDIERSRNRTRRAGQYVRMLRDRYRQLQQAKKGGDS